MQTHKTKIPVTNFAVQQIKEVGAVTRQEGISLISLKVTNLALKWCTTVSYRYITCKIQLYTILMLSLSLLGLLVFVILHSQKLKLCRRHLFSNAVKIMLFISDEQYFVPVKLCRMAGSIYLFKITDTLVPENVNLKQNMIWDIIEIGWKGVA